MSQYTRIVTNGNLPPAVPIQFTTDDGIAVPAANNLDLLGDDSTDNDVDGIRTVAAGDTVTIELTNRLQGTATSTTGSNADIVTFALDVVPKVYRFKFDVAGRETTTGDGVGYTIFASYKTDGATATIIQTEFKDADEDAALATANVTLTTDGANSVILRGTSTLTTTILYSAVGSYIVI